MKYNKLYIASMLAAITLTGCDPDGVDEVSFDVSVADCQNMIHAGKEVTFLFSGNPDYIAFYSGEEGNNYAHKDRTEVELCALSMTTAFRQQYTDREYYNKELISVYISEDFSGNYNVDNIKRATWTKISGQEDGQVKVPAPPSSSAVNTSSTFDLAAYAQKDFYVAFEYNAPKRQEIPTVEGGGKYIQAPRIDVQSLVLNKETEDGIQVAMTNTATDWGFQIVYENSEKKGTYLVNDESLLFQPQKGKEHNDDDIIVWMVSQKLAPNAVSPDRGTALKGTDVRLNSYTHTYSKPGIYTATFIATNANMWNSEQIIKQVTFAVEE